MLTKTPKVTQARPRGRHASAAERLARPNTDFALVTLPAAPLAWRGPWPSDQLEIELKKIAEHVVADMTALAKIPAQQPGGEPFPVVSAVEDSLLEWARRTEEGRRPNASKAKRLAKEFHRELQKLRSAIPGVSRVAAMVARFIEGVEHRQQHHHFMDETEYGGTAGRRRGDPRYPGLDQFVLDLEYFARCAGGRGFGLPKKKPQKGRMLQLLDQLRRRLKNDPKLSNFANALPRPGQHPISIYQRAIDQAHDEFSAERGSEI